jgi:hypothetical protein
LRKRGRQRECGRGKGEKKIRRETEIWNRDNERKVKMVWIEFRE